MEFFNFVREKERKREEIFLFCFFYLMFDELVNVLMQLVVLKVFVVLSCFVVVLFRCFVWLLCLFSWSFARFSHFCLFFTFFNMFFTLFPIFFTNWVVFVTCVMIVTLLEIQNLPNFSLQNAFSSLQNVVFSLHFFEM